jgi:hypothetical protein
MNYYYLLVICLLAILFIYCQVRIHRKYQTDYQIMQVNDPEKNVLEDTLNNKYPTILTDVIIGWKGIRDLDPQTIKDKGDKLIKDSKFLKLLNNYFGYYHLPLTISKKYSIKHYIKGDTQYITKQKEFRFYIAQIYGKSRFILFSPKEEKYLYPTKDKNYSKLNYWKISNWDKQLDKNPDEAIQNKRTKYLDKFPKFNKAKYIEIILHPGNMLYIPYNWWYTSVASDENIRLTASSKSIFSW